MVVLDGRVHRAGNGLAVRRRDDRDRSRLGRPGRDVLGGDPHGEPVVRTLDGDDVERPRDDGVAERDGVAVGVRRVEVEGGSTLADEDVLHAGARHLGRGVLLLGLAAQRQLLLEGGLDGHLDVLLDLGTSLGVSLGLVPADVERLGGVRGTDLDGRQGLELVDVREGGVLVAHDAVVLHHAVGRQSTGDADADGDLELHLSEHPDDHDHRAVEGAGRDVEVDEVVAAGEVGAVRLLHRHDDDVSKFGHPSSDHEGLVAVDVVDERLQDQPVVATGVAVGHATLELEQRLVLPRRLHQVLDLLGLLQLLLQLGLVRGLAVLQLQLELQDLLLGLGDHLVVGGDLLGEDGLCLVHGAHGRGVLRNVSLRRGLQLAEHVVRRVGPLLFEEDLPTSIGTGVRDTGGLRLCGGVRRPGGRELRDDGGAGDLHEQAAENRRYEQHEAAPSDGSLELVHLDPFLSGVFSAGGSDLHALRDNEHARKATDRTVCVRRFISVPIQKRKIVLQW